MSNTTISPTVAAVALAGLAATLILGTVLAPTGTTLNFAASPPTVSPVSPSIAAGDSGGSITYNWTGLLNGSTGAPTRSRTYSRAAIQVTGTFGTSGSVKISGSQDGTNWADISASPMTSAGFFATLSALPKYLKPAVTAGDGTTNLTVTAWLI